MKSHDVIDLYKQVAVGSQVNVIKGPLTSTSAGREYALN